MRKKESSSYIEVDTLKREMEYMGKRMDTLERLVEAQQQMLKMALAEIERGRGNHTTIKDETIDAVLETPIEVKCQQQPQQSSRWAII